MWRVSALSQQGRVGSAASPPRASRAPHHHTHTHTHTHRYTTTTERRLSRARAPWPCSPPKRTDRRAHLCGVERQRRHLGEGRGGGRRREGGVDRQRRAARGPAARHGSSGAQARRPEWRVPSSYLARRISGCASYFEVLVSASADSCCGAPSSRSRRVHAGPGWCQARPRG